MSLVQELVALVPALVSVAERSVQAAAPTVTLTQFRAMLVLSKSGPCNGTELAERLGTHPSSVTRVCDRLVRTGLVTRVPRPGNRRQVLLEVTAAGREVVQSVQRHREEQASTLLGQLPERAQQGLAQALPDLLQALQASGALVDGGRVP